MGYYFVTSCIMRIILCFIGLILCFSVVANDCEKTHLSHPQSDTTYFKKYCKRLNIIEEGWLIHGKKRAFGKIIIQMVN